MITASANLQNVFKQQSVINMTAGCTIEYNMNMMTNLSESNITGPAYATVNGKEAFKKIFPLDSIIKSYRPSYAGIKYGIFGDVSKSYNPATKTGWDYKSPKDTTYPVAYRTYFPGIDTTYKYWISNKGQGGTIAISYPKTIIANKIVLKFEASHALPATWSVSTTPSGGSESVIFSGNSSNIPSMISSNPGVVILYFTGTDWTLNEALHNRNAYRALTGIKTTFSGVTNNYVGVIEFSARWTKDISEYVVNYNLEKESSSSTDDVLPVGYVSANSLTMLVNNYNSSSMEILNYEKVNTYEVDPNKIYLVKEAVLRPYFDVFHSNGALGTSPNKYDRVFQGTFYIDSWQTDAYNEANIIALDGAKILQQTVCPPILCESYAITAIIRRLLDNIGFSNYAFNLAVNDQSIISPNYWWSDDSKTVWQAIQELCRDTQMTAVFDENNILQFYSREYMYGSRSSTWQFNYELDGSNLPDIMSLEKQDVPSANQVKILWQSAVTSNYERNAGDIWRSDTTFLGAAAIVDDIDTTDVVEGVPLKYIKLQPLVTTTYEQTTTLYSFSGYLAIEDEIIEYDAIRYQYVPIDTGISSPQYVDITSDSDIFKYRALAQPGSENFKPTGEYRIKNRKAFGSLISSHKAGTSSQVSAWSITEVKFR